MNGERLLRRSPPSGTILVGLLALLVGCQPVDERPGTWLRGEPFSAPLQDWSFTDEIDEIFIETRPWYGLPHSTTIWCVTRQGKLYIGSYGDEEKAWEKAVAHHPGARLQIGNRLHPVVIEPIRDPQLSAELDLRYETKYDMEAVFGKDLPAWRYYRVEQRRP